MSEHVSSERSQAVLDEYAICFNRIFQLPGISAQLADLPWNQDANSYFGCIDEDLADIVEQDINDPRLDEEFEHSSIDF